MILLDLWPVTFGQTRERLIDQLYMTICLVLSDCYFHNVTELTSEQ